MRAVSQLPLSYTFQSYFSDSLLQAAILEQPVNRRIVPSTLGNFQGEGYAIGLTGNSDCPVTVKIRGDRDSADYILRPGEIVRPGRFTSFEHGLPFGWLGGGLATLKIAHFRDADLQLGISRPEIIFHRTRLQIVADAVTPTLVRNWPGQFPWTRATSGANAIDQSGGAMITVEPTRTLLRLRLNDTTGKTVRLMFRGSNDFDQGSTGVVTTTDKTYVDVSFPANAGPTSTPYPMVELPSWFSRLACDEGGVSALDLGDATLTSQFIDVVRYGRI